MGKQTAGQPPYPDPTAMQPPAGLSPEAQAIWTAVTSNQAKLEAQRREAQRQQAALSGLQPRRQATAGGNPIPMNRAETTLQPLMAAASGLARADQVRAQTENENTAKLGMKPDVFPALDDDGNVMPRGPGMVQAPMLARFRSMFSGGPRGGEQWWQPQPDPAQASWWDRWMGGNG